jgi:hypothetical protein
MEEERTENIEEARISAMLDSEGWQLAKTKLLEYVDTLDNIKTLPDGTNERVGEEAKVRARVVTTLLIWLADLEAIKSAHLQGTPTPNHPEYIRVYEG